MILTISEIKSIEEVDFDSLFEASFPDLDKNYFIGETVAGPTENKKNQYKSGASDALSGNSAYKKENQEAFGFKLTIDGVDHLMNVGFLDRNTGVFETNWFLSKPYQNSRNFLYTQEYAMIRSSFFIENNIECFRILTHNKSLLHTSIKRGSNSSRVEILEEVLSDNGLIVTLMFRML
jgi:hypothetical protein